MSKAVFSIALLAFSAAAGCSAYETLDINRVHRAGHFAGCKEDSGLVAAAESYFEARKSEIHFWFDLPASDYIPVALHFENHSDKGFVLAPRSISLFLKKGGKEIKLATAMEVVEDVRYGFGTSFIYFPLLIFLGPAISIAHRVEMNYELEVDYRAKDLFRGRTAIRIPPKGALEGAVFFHGEDARDLDLEGAVVQLVLTREKGADEASGAEVRMLVPLE
jgi:hypothetical protein